MRRFPALILLAASLSAVPVLAAGRTEVIRLTFLPAAELDQFLTAAPADPQYGFGGGLGSPRASKGIDDKDRPDLIPKGIAAWAVDARKNAVSVTGSDEAIGQFKKIVRLLDVPARQIRIAARMVELDPAEVAALRARPETQVGEGVTLTTLTRSEDRKRLEALPALFSTTLQISNNRVLHMRVPSVAGEDSRRASLVPRVNGDSSLTIIASGLIASKPGSKDYPLLLRVSTGQSVVVLDEERRAWLIAPELLPTSAR
jgi:hypothetical protein